MPKYAAESRSRALLLAVKRFDKEALTNLPERKEMFTYMSKKYSLSKYSCDLGLGLYGYYQYYTNVQDFVTKLTRL